MKKWLSRLDESWYFILIAGVILTELLVFGILGQDSYLTVQDNLDLFVAHFQVLNHSDSWFSNKELLPMLGGLSRDCLSSELNLYNMLFMIFPVFTAYMIGYFLKILIGMCSFVLLIKDILGEKFAPYRGIAWGVGLAYGMLPLFPAYGLAFASIPLAVWILRRLYLRQGKRYYLFLFLYPFVSYFSYFGFFLLAYLVCAIVILWIRDKKPSLQLIIGLFLLAAGYVCFEHRLFAQMLFSQEESIRSTMVDTDLDFFGVLISMKDAFVSPVFHADSVHKYFVLPVCLIFFVYRLICLIREKQAKKIFSDSFVLVMLFIVFNCIIYGFYFWGGFRRLFETLVPVLKGFQFNRTIFFNPFLWYAAFFMVLKYLYDKKQLLFTRAANLLSCVAVAAVILAPAVYNEFYYTCYHQAYKLVKNTEVNMLNFREYYSEDLLEEIKEDIDYQGEYAAAYGLNPAVLQYSGVATLDGYLGFYDQSYKDEFTKLIAPALNKSEEFYTYYVEWGARAYLFAGSGENTFNPYRNLPLQDKHLYIDGDQFRKMGGTYIFSRYELDNMDELGFLPEGVYETENSPYTIYLYKTQPDE